MNRLPVKFLPGLSSNDTALAAQGQCIDAANIRWVDGKPQVVGGCVKYFADQLSGVCRNVLGWFDLAGYENQAFGTHSHLYAYANGNLADITPTSDFTVGAEHGAGGPGYGAGEYGTGTYGGNSPDDYFPLTWSLVNYGESLIANPRLQGIFIWGNNPASPAALIATAPEKVICTLVTPQQQVLALGCTQVDGTFNPMCIRGSKTGTYDEWTPGPATTAFEAPPLETGGGGRIVGAAIVAPYVGVWTDHGFYRGEYTGNLANLYRFDLVSTGCGLIGPNALQVDGKGRAWWISPDHQFWTWMPGEMPTLVACPIRDDFKDNIAAGQFEKIAACSIGQYGEVWWSYPDARDGLECSRTLSVTSSVPFGQPYQWSRGDFVRSALVDAKATAHPIFVSPGGYVYSHEDGQTDDGDPLSGFYTVSLPSIDDGGREVLVKGVVPDFKSQVGALSLSFRTHFEPQDEGFEEGPFVLAPGQGKETFLFSARSAEMTLAWDSSPAFHRAGKPVLLFEVTGGE